MKSLLLSLLSALLLSLAWPPISWTPLIFVAWVPLLFLWDERINDSRKRPYTRIFAWNYLAFLLWNIATTYWVFNATPAAIGAFTVNALLMTSVVALFFKIRKRVFPSREAWWLLPFLWVGFEFFHQNWDLSWPWLSIGNVFAPRPSWVQFYEWTGSLGGSIWVLSVNILVFLALRSFFRKDPRSTVYRKATFALALICLPLTISQIRYHTFKPQGETIEVAVIQPNVDPYKEQYELDPLEVTRRLLNSVESIITPKTRLILTPESMLQEYVWEHDIDQCQSLLLIQEFVRRYSACDFLAGLSSFKVLEPDQAHSHAARKLQFGDISYEAHNMALLVQDSAMNQFSYKSKLTPGVEIMPFVRYFKPLERLAIDLGGTIGTLGTMDTRTVMYPSRNAPPFSAVICYESIYGDFVSQYVRNGAQYLCIITNDAWWGNTAGHKQHAQYARLRAIENRRYVVRSANTGISCVISPKGDVIKETRYWEKDAFVCDIQAIKQVSFYSRYGDILGKGSLMLLCLLGVLWISMSLSHRIKSRS